MEKIFQANKPKKQAGVSITVFNKIDFKPKEILRNTTYTLVIFLCDKIIQWYNYRTMKKHPQENKCSKEMKKVTLTHTVIKTQFRLNTKLYYHDWLTYGLWVDRQFLIFRKKIKTVKKRKAGGVCTEQETGHVKYRRGTYIGELKEMYSVSTGNELELKCWLFWNYYSRKLK